MFGLIPRRKERRVERYLPYEPPMELRRREFAPLFERMFGRWPVFTEPEGVAPYGPELEDKPDVLIVREAVPGFEAKEIDVKISGGLLTIRAEKREEKAGEEKLWGELERTVVLPEGLDVEHVEATYRNGVLEVRLPKLPEAKERRIEVKA
jgi:HSP20 family protein